MKGWTPARLGDTCTVVGGGTPTRSNTEYFGGSIPWITPKDMKTWEIHRAEIGITEIGLENSATRLVPANSVLLVVRSGVLKHTIPIAISRVPVAINQDMKAIQCKDRLHPDFLARFLKARSPIILQWVRATTADNFSIDKLKDLEIPLPPISEQRRIAKILDKADALRARRRAALTKLDDLTQAIFLDMFGGSASRGWNMTTIAGIANSVKGSIRTGPFGSQLLHSEFTDSGIAVLGIDNVVANEFRWGDRRFISEEKYRQLKRYTVRPGDVLISIMGTCGRCAVVPDDIPLAINTKHLCCMTLDRSKCLPVFLHAYFLQHPIARRFLAQTAKGAIMSGLNMGLIEEMPVPLPPLKLQLEFERKMNASEKIRAAMLISLAKFDSLFASLQHRAFRGEL
ncbi:MAG: restriction endonuclease subunit S [Planctomycetota bacterium]